MFFYIYNNYDYTSYIILAFCFSLNYYFMFQLVNYYIVNNYNF